MNAKGSALTHFQTGYFDLSISLGFSKLVFIENCEFFSQNLFDAPEAWINEYFEFRKVLLEFRTIVGKNILN